MPPPPLPVLPGLTGARVFLSAGKVKKYAHLIALPTDKKDFFEPLHRMRVIVGNIEANARAVFPANSWMRTFRAWKLPSSLSSRGASPEARKEVKRQLLRLFEGAGYEKDRCKEMFCEVVSLLPAAEAGARLGLTCRQAWAKASRDYPERVLGRDAVNLLLGCVHTTGETERFLKVLAEQNDGERGLQGGETLNGILQVCRHSPPVEEISLEVTDLKKVRPRGTYLPRVTKAYKQLFSGGKRLLKARKVRRDKNVKRDQQKLERQRVKRGAPEPEIAFYRRRDRQVEEVVNLPQDERAQKLRRTALGAVPVPAEKGLFVTDAIKDVRAKAAERERKKMENIEQTHAVGSTGSAPKAKAKAKAKSGLTGSRWRRELKEEDAHADCTATRDTKKGQLVLLENKEVKWPTLLSHGTGWWVCHTWPGWLKQALERSSSLGGRFGHLKRTIVLKDVHDGTVDRNCTALCGRLVGGFLTTEQQVTRSQRSRSAPAQGVWYTGVAHGGPVCLWLSPKLLENKALEPALECLKALCGLEESTLREESSLAKIQRNYRKHKAEKGTRSKPWKQFAALVDDDVEQKERDSKEFPRLVRTFHAWLEERSHVPRATPPLVLW